MRGKKPQTSRQMLAPSNPYLRCLEYSCLVDILVKLMSFVLPNTTYVKNSRIYWGETCHQLYGVSRILNMLAKFYSLIISVIGMRGCWYQNLDMLVAFQRHFKFYVFGELFCLLFSMISIAVSNCSNIPTGARVTYVTEMMVIGVVFLAVYYAFWKFFVNRTIEFMQNQEMKIPEEDEPKSFIFEDEHEKLVSGPPQIVKKSVNFRDEPQMDVVSDWFDSRLSLLVLRSKVFSDLDG